MKTIQRKNNFVKDALRKGIYAVAVTGLLLGPVALRAQDTQQNIPTQSQQQSQSKQSQSSLEDRISINVLDNTQLIDNKVTNSEATKMEIGFNKWTLGVIGGVQNTWSKGELSTTYDFSLRGTFNGKGKDMSWVRAGLLNDTNADKNVSYGADAYAKAFSLLDNNLTVSFMGGIYSMNLGGTTYGPDAARHTNYWGGSNFNIYNQNVFFMVGNTGVTQSVTEGSGKNKKTVKVELHEDFYRAGYGFTNYKDHLAYFFLDKNGGQKFVYTGLFGWNFARVLASYDQNIRSGFGQMYLKFGMGELSEISLTTQLLQEFAYTPVGRLVNNTSNGGFYDSNNTVRFSTPPPFFITRPTHNVGVFAKVSGHINPKDAIGHWDLDTYLVAAHKSGFFLTFNSTKDTGSLKELEGKTIINKPEWHNGAGVGYKSFKHPLWPTIVFVDQTHGDRYGSLIFTFSGKK